MDGHDAMEASLKELLLEEKIPPNFIFSNNCFYLVGFPPILTLDSSRNHDPPSCRSSKSSHVPSSNMTLDFCRLIRRCMGTIYWETNESISHVIVHYECDAKIRNDVMNFCRNHPNRPAAVSPEWIFACVRMKQVVDVANYPPQRPVNTLKVKKKTKSPPIVPKRTAKSSIFHGRFFHIIPNDLQQEKSQSHHGDSSDIVLFHADKMEKLILSHGGRILSKEGIRILQHIPSANDEKRNVPGEPNSKERKCYIVHLGGTTTSFDFKRVVESDALLSLISQRNLCQLQAVNGVWVQTCDATRLEISPMSYEKLFMPQAQAMRRLDTDVKVNVAVTGFVGEERIGLKMMLLAIGADYTENMSRDNTHLICREASGAKYVKAMEWNLHVVTVEWLYHIAYFGYEVGSEKSFGVVRQSDSCVD